MLNIYDINALVHWEERDILLREHFVRLFSDEVRNFLRSQNAVWDVPRVEAPTLVPRTLISDAYANDDVWVQERRADTDTELVLRPETTPSTYVYMQHLLNTHSRTRLPLCVWQAGKSYRREQDQPSKHVRLKEFWQLEFQCAFTADTGNDYHARSLEPIRRMIASMIQVPTRIVPSDRLPAYSEITMDVEVDNGDKWMEVCSISRRTDFPQRFRSTTRKGDTIEQDVLVLEIAIGLDRCVYNWNLAAELKQNTKNLGDRSGFGRYGRRSRSRLRSRKTVEPGSRNPLVREIVLLGLHLQDDRDAFRTKATITEDRTVALHRTHEDTPRPHRAVEITVAPTGSGSLPMGVTRAIGRKTPERLQLELDTLDLQRLRPQFVDRVGIEFVHAFDDPVELGMLVEDTLLLVRRHAATSKEYGVQVMSSLHGRRLLQKMPHHHIGTRGFPER